MQIMFLGAGAFAPAGYPLVSVGNTAGLCAIVAKEKGEVTEWNLKGPKQYEPPCDFIAYFE